MLGYVFLRSFADNAAVFWTGASRHHPTPQQGQGDVSSGIFLDEVDIPPPVSRIACFTGAA
jgi:hypothetical protein